MRIAKKRRLGVIYTPLDVSVDIVPYGGTVDRQVYNSATGGFYPDYEDGPLCLFPVCRAVNSRDVNGSGEDVNINGSDNFTFSWYELVYNKTSNKYVKGDAIVNGKNGYEIVSNSTDGLTKGMLLVNKNSSVQNPIRLQFEGRYVDPQSGQVYNYVAQKTILCDDMEETVPVLHVSPTVAVWNPITEASTVTFEALLTDGSGDITNAKNTKFGWYRKVNVQGTSYDLQLIDGTHIEDVDMVSMSTKKAVVDGVETDVQGSTLTIDRNLIGDMEMYVCKAMRRTALTSSDTFGERDPYAELAAKRTMPDYKAYILGVSNASDPDQEYINPRCVVEVDGKTLTDEEVRKFFNVYWTVRKADETVDKVVSNEINPEIPFSAGMIVGLGVEDKGAQKLLMDGDTYVATDEGKLVYSN